ncbi:BadF/BadG/BcrA/BcrD ATPase family protein, partial [Sphingomonas asaccharolytica]|uniref:BadF/BadG/BcrA/BcrD ATPase family protein n=1 Tax=Sphingomonas asaccharolytica TaxID=40681 RepID=UPI000AAAEBB3
AAAGDPAAIAIHNRAAEELATMAEALRAQLGFAAEEDVHLSWSGGVLANDASIRARLEARLRQRGPYRILAPRHSPAYGAALYAAHQVGGTPA